MTNAQTSPSATATTRAKISVTESSLQFNYYPGKHWIFIQFHIPGLISAEGEMAFTKRFSAHFIKNYSIHPPHRQALRKLGMFQSIPLVCLARELLSMQGKLVENEQTHLLKQNFSDIITTIDNSCMLPFNPSINPVCWYYFLMLVLIIV